MKLLKLNFLLVLVAICFTSCSKSPAGGEYVGHWEIKSYEVNSEIYERVNALPNDNYGFSILSDGTFIENKNSGWCGTPPICYARYEGAWEELSDELLEMNATNWSTNNTIYNFEILSVSDNKLEIIRSIQ